MVAAAAAWVVAVDVSAGGEEHMRYSARRHAAAPVGGSGGAIG